MEKMDHLFLHLYEKICNCLKFLKHMYKPISSQNMTSNIIYSKNVKISVKVKKTRYSFLKKFL